MTISDDTRAEGEQGGGVPTGGHRGGQPATPQYPPPPYLERSAIQWDQGGGTGGRYDNGAAPPPEAGTEPVSPAGASRHPDGAGRDDTAERRSVRPEPTEPPRRSEAAEPPRRPEPVEVARRTGQARQPQPDRRAQVAEPDQPRRVEPVRRTEAPAVPAGPRAGSVADAAETPDQEQPYAELGLRPDEYERIHRILGRRPTSSELAMYSIMWSEHCSYKSSKVHLRQFSEKAPRSAALLAGIGENAGVIQISEDLAVTFKIESHNHPSFVEPHQGAATGVGGIVRDILAMGARPVGVMDSLRFGAADHPDTARVLPGIVDGVGGYGNCLGLPNVGGEVVFDPCYQGNPLVNALCVGVLPADRLQNKAAAGPGNVVVLLGAKTGRDGIGGVSVLASATFEDASHARRPSVQVGDPFTEKLLIESCLEMYDLGLIAGIQDLGGAGLTCALSETAAAADTGMRVWLDQVPLREASMSPEEILASESQERMLLIVEPERMNTVLAVAEKWGVLATPIGRVTESDGEGGRLVVSWRDQIVVDVPPGSLADGPVYARPMREPGDLVLLQADRGETLPRPADGDQMRRTLLDLLASPNLCDKSWVTDQYDRYVLGNTVLAQPEDAGVLRIDERSGLGVALSVDGNGRYARLDPYRGAQLALAEAYRNVAMTGAQPLAVTNCLNFGSPEDPAVMWQFAEAVRGLADGCAELGIPVTGGNVSFYNQTGAAPVNPTPVVGVLGVLPQVRDRVPMGFRHDGDVLILLGETREELSGSEWAWVAHRHLGGVPPRVDLAAERALGALVSDAASRGQLTAAHDLSDGGLAQALVEGCLRYGHGAKILLPSEVSAFTALFSESTARAVVSVPHGQERGFTALCDEYGVPWTAIGVVTVHDPVLDIRDQFTIPLDELRQVYESTLPDLFGQRDDTLDEDDEPRAAAGGLDATADRPDAGAATAAPDSAAGSVGDETRAGAAVPDSAAGRDGDGAPDRDAGRVGDADRPDADASTAPDGGPDPRPAHPRPQPVAAPPTAPPEPAVAEEPGADELVADEPVAEEPVAADEPVAEEPVAADERPATDARATTGEPSGTDDASPADEAPGLAGEAPGPDTTARPSTADATTGTASAATDRDADGGAADPAAVAPDASAPDDRQAPDDRHAPEAGTGPDAGHRTD